MWRDQSSPGETVGCGQDPLCIDEGAAAEVSSVTVQTGLPGPRPHRSILATDDPAVQRCLATNWRQTVEHYVRWWRSLVPGIRWLLHEECRLAVTRFHLALLSGHRFNVSKSLDVFRCKLAELTWFPSIRLMLSASCLTTQTAVGVTSTHCQHVGIV